MKCTWSVRCGADISTGTAPNARASHSHEESHASCPSVGESSEGDRTNFAFDNCSYSPATDRGDEERGDDDDDDDEEAGHDKPLFDRAVRMAAWLGCG